MRGNLNTMHELTQKNETQHTDTHRSTGTPVSAPGPDHAVLQKRTAAIQDSPYLSAQRKRLTAAFGSGAGVAQRPMQQKVAQRTENKTGMPDEVKARMESAFNTDFSGVRVHPESSAAPAVGALAYTQGTDIHFAPGQFSPNNSAGQRLLGHELAHVQQQSQGRVTPTTEINGLPVNDSPALEEEADQMGEKVMSFSKTLQTQRKVASTTDNVVQRFKFLGSHSYSLDKDTGLEARAPFTRFDDELSTVENKKGPTGHKWKETKDDMPPLKVANDDTLAINSTEGEPKEFYADAEVIANSNAALRGVKSPIILIQKGNKITVGGKELVMVQPQIEGKKAPGKDNFAKLTHDICRDSAKEIMGGKISHAILKDGTGQKRVEINTSDSTEVSGTQNLAKYMADGGEDVSVGGASDAMKSKENPKFGKTYGTESREGGKASSAAEKLGVNEHAWSKVGQGYVIQSIFDEEGSKKDFGKSNEPTYQFVWGYHYSSVVAESLGGKDQIAMENYARKADINKGRIDLLAELKTKFAAKIKNLVMKGGDDQQIGMILKFVHENLEVSEKEAVKAYNDMFKEMNGHIGEHWYFRMNGQEAGQSFHEQMADSHFFVNPLTLSVANMAKDAMKVTFNEGSTALSNAGENYLKTIATDILRTIDQGQTIAKVKLKGYASGWKGTGIGAANKGNARAEAVKVKLVELDIPEALLHIEDSPGRAVNEYSFTNRKVEIYIE